MPIAERQTTLFEEVSDISNFEKKVVPPVKFGNEESWLIERKFFVRKNSGPLQTWSPAGGIDGRRFPRIVRRQRQGWYLTPSPIHRLSRKVVTVAAIILFIALAYQAFEPLFLWLGFISSPFGGSVKLGMLDYPLLLLLVLPWMILPLFLRLIANIRDLRRQKSFLSAPPINPEVVFTSAENDANSSAEDDDNSSAVFASENNLALSINLPETRSDWLDMDVYLQVGLLPPARETLLKAFGRGESEQPPPGMSTPLPHYWEKGLSDGTGIGEETPLERQDASGGIFLRPMRICQRSDLHPLPLTGGELEIVLPPDWPGTQAGSFVRIHWELIIKVNRVSHGPLLWVKPLRITNGSGPFKMPHLQINDGRSEES